MPFIFSGQFYNHKKMKTQQENEWEEVNDNGWVGTIDRLKIFGGWLVKCSGGGIAFVPDVKHEWKIET